MTGFLASLAARSTGDEPVLEPRRQLFAPPEDVPAAGEPRRAPLPARAPAADAETLPPPPAAWVVDDVRADRPVEEQPERPRAVPEPSPVEEHHETVVLRPAAPALSSARADARRSAERAGPPSRREPDGEGSPVPRASPLAPRARPLAPRAGARPGLLNRREPIAPTAQEEQVVRITIGRVDVRAVHEPAPSPRPRSAPPRMTLAEYLARGRRS